MKWSDGQPLTAEDVAYTINRSREEEWLNHSASTGNLTAKATSPTTVEVTSTVVDPKLPTLDVYILPKHVFEKYDAKAITKCERPDRRRLRPVHARRVQEGPVRALRGQPELLGRQAGARRGRHPRVQQRRRDGRRAARAARSTSSRRAGDAVPRPAGGPETSRRSRAPGRLRRVRAQRRRRPQEGPPGARGPEGARGDRARDRQADDRRPRAARARRARPRR